ncbi:MAG: hypothetical protein ACI4JB_02900, partial [Porcipelethomonas sp.]
MYESKNQKDCSRYSVGYSFNTTACSNKTSWDGKWEITDADYENMKIAEVISAENDGTRYATLSAEGMCHTFVMSCVI